LDAAIACANVHVLPPGVTVLSSVTVIVPACATLAASKNAVARMRNFDSTVMVFPWHRNERLADRILRRAGDSLAAMNSRVAIAGFGREAPVIHQHADRRGANQAWPELVFIARSRGFWP
jgi:hypothetical protein